jgi:hypothetical protein
MKTRIGFSSILGSEYLEDLERLLFFNPQQKRALNGIHHSIREYGVPSIALDAGRLRVRVEQLPEVQTLYALEDADKKPILVGVMVFSRIDPSTIALLHIAVREEYSRFGARADAMLVAKFLEQLRQIAKKLKGVQAISLKYASGLTVPVQ